MRQQAFRARPRRRRMLVETGPPSSGAEPEMGGGLHVFLDRRRVALHRGGHGSLFPTSGGWSMQATMTAQLVTEALMMVIWWRGKPEAVLHHSD